MRPVLARAAALPWAAARTTRPVARRFYSDQPTNPTSQFYKTFTRPVFKVLLTAVFTYQVVYWSWVKLEADEMRRDTDAAMSDLERSINEYKDSKSDESAKK